MESRSKDKKEKDECTPTRKERYNISQLIPILVLGFRMMFHFMLFYHQSNKLEKYFFMINMFGSCLQEAELAEKWDSSVGT